MSKPDTKWASAKGKADKEAGRSANPPHGLLSSTLGSLADGNYVKRDGENNAYWNAYKSAQAPYKRNDD